MSCRWAPLTGAWPRPPGTGPEDTCRHDGIPPQPPPLQAGQTQLSQPSLAREMLQSPHHLHSPTLAPPQQLPVSFELGSPALDPAPQMCLTRAEQRAGSPPSTCWPRSSRCTQGPTGRLGRLVTLPAHGQLAAHQSSQAPLHRDAPQQGSHSPYWCVGLPIPHPPGAGPYTHLCGTS